MVTNRLYRSTIARFLRTRRNYPLYPHRLAQPLAEFLAVLAEVSSAVGDELSDARWNEAAIALRRAAESVAAIAR